MDVPGTASPKVKLPARLLQQTTPEARPTYQPSPAHGHARWFRGHDDIERPSDNRVAVMAGTEGSHLNPIANHAITVNHANRLTNAVCRATLNGWVHHRSAHCPRSVLYTT
jgi:hypothetical protein